MIAWEWLDRPGLEVLDLAVGADGVRAQGMVVAELEGMCGAAALSARMRSGMALPRGRDHARRRGCAPGLRGYVHARR